MDAQEARTLLESNPRCRIVFEKADGSRVETFGTRMTSAIPESQKPTGNGTARNDNQVSFFDVQEVTPRWRSFVTERLITLEAA